MNINFAPAPVQSQGFVDPNEIARRDAIARALQEQASGMQDIQSPWQGVNQVAQAVVGGMGSQRVAQEESGNRKLMAEILSGASSGQPISQDKLAMLYALDPELGMSLSQQQQAKAQAEGDKQRVVEALSAMGMTKEAQAVMSGLLNVDDASALVMKSFEAPAPTVNFDDTSGIRKEVQGLPSYKNLAQASPIYQSMFETAGRNSRASDLNLVYGLGKIMDPTSVVREGEMFMVQGINTLPDKLVQGINSVLTGASTLTPETRRAILQEAYGRMKGYQDAFEADASMYRGIADRYKMNPADILPSFETAQEWQPPPEQPPVGEEVTAVNPATGERIKLVDGQWVPY